MAHYPGPFVDPVTKLPGELFHRTAELLTLNERFVAATVSRSWRKVLFDAPLLWSTIAICPRTIGNLRNFAEVLDALFKRSQGVTVIVRLFLKADRRSEDADVESFEPGGPFLDAIPQLLAREMHRVRVLELVIHEWSGTAWEMVFRQPAPALERFNLVISCGEDNDPLPDDLLGNYAPLLRHVHFRGATMPENPGAAFAGVTSLYYNIAGHCDHPTLTRLCEMSNLQDLTLAVTDDIEDERDEEMDEDEAMDEDEEEPKEKPQPVGPPLRRLQLWNSPGTHVVLQYFPQQQHLCFSASITHDLGPDDTEENLLLDAIRAKGAPRSLAIGFRAPRMTYYDSSPQEGSVYAVRLDGRDVVVDLLLTETTRLLRALPTASLVTARLQTLAIPVQLLPHFDLPDLPALLEFALFVPPPGNKFPATETMSKLKHQHRVQCLRIVQVVAPQTWPAWDIHKMRPAASMLKPIPGNFVLEVMQYKVVPGSLQLLVLDGFTLAPNELEHVRRYIPRIAGVVSGGWMPDDDCGQWQWRFPEGIVFRT